MTHTNGEGSARYDGDGEPTQTLPTAPVPALELAGVGAGIVGAVLTAVGVWGLHVLTRGDGVAGAAGWVILLCLAFTALGKGITLLRRALAPVTAAALAPLAGVSASVRATAGIVIGAAGIWWVMRGYAASWWTHTTGTASGWTLTTQLVQLAIIAVAGALLFGGARTLATLIFANSGTRGRGNTKRGAGHRWVLWWSSHPGLGLLLLAGAAALVFLSGYVVPRVSGWLTGDDPTAALAAITAILTVAFCANTWWWKALTGWWSWAHTHGSGGGGASPLGQMHAGAAVIALIWFSAMGFGLASPADYTGPGAPPHAHAQCPPDCGGGDNGGSYGPPNGGQMFQPPSQGGPQMPDYQGGINQPPLDQNGGISIYNENPSAGQVPSQTGGQQSMQDPSFRANPDGSWQARNGEWSPPNYQTATPGLTQGPGQPNPDWSGNQVPQINTPQQPVQQAPQAPQPAQQAPQAPQQPAQAPQQPQQPQPQQVQKQPEQAPPKQPDIPKKTAIDPTDLAVAATRRGSQQAGQQAAQQGTAQAVSKSSQIATQMSGTYTNMSGPAPMEPTPSPNPGPLWQPTTPDGPAPQTGSWVDPNTGQLINHPPSFQPSTGSSSQPSGPNPNPAQSPKLTEAEQAVVDRSDQAKWLADWNNLQERIIEHNARMPATYPGDAAEKAAYQAEFEELTKEQLSLQADAWRMTLPDVPIASLQRPGS